MSCSCTRQTFIAHTKNWRCCFRFIILLLVCLIWCQVKTLFGFGFAPERQMKKKITVYINWIFRFHLLDQEAFFVGFLRNVSILSSGWTIYTIERLSCHVIENLNMHEIQVGRVTRYKYFWEKTKRGALPHGVTYGLPKWTTLKILFRMSTVDQCVSSISNSAYLSLNTHFNHHCSTVFKCLQPF